MAELLAPNGQPSNLTPEQWKLVREPAFKKWFGDWENSPESASKVVDKNGEPLVVYHGSKSFDINEFELSQSKRKSSGLKEFGTYFTDNKKLAEAYKNWSELKSEFEKEIDIQIQKWDEIQDKVRNNRDYENAEKQIKLLKESKKGKIYNVFLNLRKVEVFDAEGNINIEAWNNLKVKASYKLATNRDAMEFLKEGKFGVEKVDGIVATNIVDAFVQTEDLKKELLSNVYLVFDSKNIKLADGTNTTFDGNNPDIRFDEGGKVEDLISQGVVELKMFDTKPEHAKEYGLDSVNPLYVQSLCITENKRLKGIGNKVLKYIDDYAINNGHDVVFGHITQKAEFTKDNRETFFCDTDMIKNWLHSKGYAINNDNNDFHKIVNNDIRFAQGGVIINPTEIECHNCHWHWKVKDGGDDLFICHKCYTDNTKYYKFEGLEGEKILDTISSNNPNNQFDGGGILDGLTEEQITYIDIISNYDGKGKGELSEKYKKILKEKTGIDYDEYYGKIDEDLIKNADVNNIKTKNDFLNYDNWIKYSYEILRKRGFDKNPVQHIEGKLTFDKIKEFCDNLNIPFEIIPENLDMGNYASHSMGNIKIPIDVDINTFIHEIGHFYDWENQYEGIAKNPAYATSFYLLKNADEVYAENFMHYFIATEWLKNNMPIVYEELDRTISLEYKKNILELINSLNNFKKGGRTISQTPAPEKDQIKGSDKNKEGSAKDISSAKKIKFSDDVLEKIQNSVDKHNKKHPNKKITIDSAKAVVRRGMGAYSSTHRPTISGGDENSRVAWGLARLNAFTYKIINGKSKSGKYSQDNDLIEELGYKVDKYEIGGVFHGSSYYFDKFNTEKIGSGIGQQQDGWGIYLTDDKKSSKNYGNYIYETTLFKDKNLDEYTFLDINKPVKKDLVKKIIEPFQKLGFNVSEILEFDYMGFLFYKTLSRKLGGDKKASLFLLNNGIDGIKRSFENSEGVIYRNDYVIFDENAITIESKEHLPNNYYADGGEINNIMKNEIIDILSKNARYGKQILSVQEVGFEVIQSCIESNTYFGNSIKQANENYIMIPVNYEDKLWAIDKKVGYVYFAKTNENTKIRVEYKYDLQDYPVPILFDSEIMNNKEFYDVNDFEEINVREFDSEFLYRGINNDEMLSIIENSFIKSNASMNIGQQQAESTSFAQHISQASAYAVGFNAWYDEVTFAKPKYILKVKKEGVNYKPTIETDIQNEVDVFGEIPIQQIESIYEIKLGECQMGNVEINVGYENNFSEGSRSPMFKKVFVRKTDVNTLINEINSKNNIEKNNDMTNSNPKDTITMDIPLLIRFSELMREDIKTDVALHEIIENLIDIKDKGVLTMSDYDSIIGNVTGTEENTNTDAVEEEKMAEGGKVNSIKYKKGDIKISLDENWYSDDSSVELVPVSELMKFREFDRKVKPKYNQDNSRDNINHLKFMFQKDGVKEPIIIEYSAQDNSVLVIEGNHRINSAIDLGMEYLPARVVLKKYSKFTPSQLKNSMKVEGIKANSSNYIPSELKASHIGITGSMPIYSDGGIIEGRLHSECGDDGCGRKFQVGENGHIIEAERDEAVIVADAFYSNEELTIKGTPSEVASALNVIGGGKNFDIGATIIKNGQELEIPELKKEATDTDVEDIIDSGSIIINRRSMADEKEYKVTGTPKQIASAINSINGNGVVIEKGAEIKEN